MSEPKRLSNDIFDYVDRRYHHNSTELKLVSKLLDVLNEELPDEYEFQGSLDVHFVDIIAGRIESVPDYGWFYFPTAMEKAPEKGNA